MRNQRYRNDDRGSRRLSRDDEGRFMRYQRGGASRDEDEYNGMEEDGGAEPRRHYYGRESRDDRRSMRGYDNNDGEDMDDDKDKGTGARRAKGASRSSGLKSGQKTGKKASAGRNKSGAGKSRGRGWFGDSAGHAEAGRHSHDNY